MSNLTEFSLTSNKLPALEYLIITQGELKAFGNNTSPVLKGVSLSGNLIETFKNNSFPNLSSVNLANNYLSDDIVDDLTSCCPKLTFIRLGTFGFYAENNAISNILWVALLL